MAKVKVTKTSQIFSDNEKMDNSGLAGKPRPMEMYAYVPPPMNIDEIMEVREYKTSKRPDTEEE
tara:strand:+ start:1785 stop:1976 length:192 start_codon:yes stop_codon:yes gene_type:complete